MKIIISFGKSSSKAYPLAVNLAREFYSYKEEYKGKAVQHLVEVDAKIFEDQRFLEKVFNLLNFIKNWVSTNIVWESGANKKRIQAWTILSDLGEIIFCYRERTKSFLREEYCLGKNTPSDETKNFGCRFLTKVITMHMDRWSHIPAWFEFGEFIDESFTIFKIDKNKIIEYLKTVVPENYFSFCPAFFWQRVYSQIEYLPEYIDLISNPKWELRFGELNPNKVLGIMPKDSITQLNEKLKEIIGTNCPVCGRLLAKTFNFCPSCGSTISI